MTLDVLSAHPLIVLKLPPHRPKRCHFPSSSVWARLPVIAVVMILIQIIQGRRQ
jgi:hypothetical protein